MSDTPRTDRAANESIVSVYETSKQLERELARAKALAESNGKLAHDTAIRLACIAAQRDNLLEALEVLTLAIGLTPIAGNKDALQESFDIARAAITKAKGEPS
jgi:hypothetical protein